MPINSELQEPLVSVIIPTYNRPLYLKQAIESAVQQRYRTIEIIVSDNCSSESPQALVESFQDSRIRFWRNKSNLGMFANTMNGFKMARGKYVANLHDDDMWKEDFLEKLVPPLEANPNVALAFCDQYIIDGEGNINYPLTERYTRSYKRDRLKEGVHQPFYEIGLIDKAVPSVVSALIRKDAINWDSIPPEVGGMYDMYLTYLCCRSGLGAYYCPERLAQYREHEETETQLSGSRDVQAKIKKGKSEIFCYERFMEDEQLQAFRSYFKQRWLHAHTTLGIGLLRANQAAEARPYLLRALRQQKFNLRTTAALILSVLPV